MNCPHCKKLLTNQMKEICLGCGAQFDEPTREKIGIYFEIREYMSAMQGVQNSHQTLINKISNKLQLLGNLFNRELKAERVEKTVKEPEAVPSQPDVIPQVQQKPAAAASEKEKKKKDSQFELAIGQKLFLIIGLITIVFGVGYFLKYSFEQGWVKPEWRVLSTYAWGLGMLFAGNQFRKKNYEAFGLNIIGGGIAVLYFGAFAAFQLYDLVGQGPSFLIMAAITVLSGILALRYNAVGLACLGIFGGFLTPLLLSTGTSNHIFLLSYILLLNAGVLWISFYRKWGVLQVLGFISTYLLYTGWFMNDYGKELFWPGVIYLNLYYLMYAVAPLAYSLFRKKDSEIKGLGIIFLNSFIAFVYSWTMVSDKFYTEMVSVVTVIYAFIFLSLAAYLHKRGLASKKAFVVFIGKAAFFLFLTVPFYFSGHWVTLFWLFLAVLLYWMGERLNRRSLEAWSYILSLFVGMKFFLYDCHEIFHFSLYSWTFLRGYSDLLIERYLTSIALVGTFSWLSWKTQKGVSAFFAVITGGVLFAVLNIEVIAFFNVYAPKAAFASVSLLWGIYSAVLLVIGFWKNKSAVRRVSIGLFTCTLIKVFFFDMARVSTPARILSFIVTGLLLVGTSFLYYRFKEKIALSLGGDQNDN